MNWFRLESKAVAFLAMRSFRSETRILRSLVLSKRIAVSGDEEISWLLIRHTHGTDCLTDVTATTFIILKCAINSWKHLRKTNACNNSLMHQFAWTDEKILSRHSFQYWEEIANFVNITAFRVFFERWKRQETGCKIYFRKYTTKKIHLKHKLV